MRRGEQEESMRSPCRAGENAPTGQAGTRIAASGSANIDGIIIVRWQLLSTHAVDTARIDDVGRLFIDCVDWRTFAKYPHFCENYSTDFLGLCLFPLNI
jgi:hypothetical protein